jgi:hypothetical protein
VSEMRFSTEVRLDVRRCGKCRAWFGSETCSDWLCGSCAMASRDERCKSLAADVSRLTRSNSALRGALTKSKHRSGK